MEETDIGKRVVVIISEHQGITETITGTLTKIFDDDLFEITDKWGNRSEWSRRNIKGFRFRGDA